MKTTIVIENGRLTLTTDDGNDSKQNQEIKIAQMPLVASDIIPASEPKNLAVALVDHEIKRHKELASKVVVNKKTTDKSVKRNCEICGDDISSTMARRKICDKPSCANARQKAYTAASKNPDKPKRSKLMQLIDKSDTPLGKEEWCTECKKFTTHSAEEHNSVMPSGTTQIPETEASTPKPIVEKVTGEFALYDDNGKFIDPWDCPMCRDEGDECNLHYSMHMVGKRPPEIKTEIRR